MPHNERFVVITGASSGIGLATAHAFARAGARLFLVGRHGPRLRAIAATLKAVPVQADITTDQDVKAVAETVKGQAGRLDVLVNCAGQFELGPAQHLGFAAVERLLRVNFLGAAAMIHACLPLLRLGQQPAIVNVSSLAGRVAPPFMAAYAASKFALNGYSHALRQELRPQGIHVGLVLPGPVNTPMVDGKLGGEHYPLLPGVPVLSPLLVARAILQAVEQRSPELVVPRRLAMTARLGAAFPTLVDQAYRRIPALHTGETLPQ